ncbi:MAG: IMP dehydrogenase [Parcubacteria group bacterium Gr01-1014_38]|nr:MAG: IMP dehydrogenase [Parcubacteria group bacterium Gr01-1014_38]
MHSTKKDAFFARMEALGLAVTFDDVRLRTGHAQVMPNQVSVESRFSRSVPLPVPLVSAAMDTVTEHALAIAMAKQGGLGILHRGLSAEDQAAEVARVKYHLNGMIVRPICVKPEDTVHSILARREKKGWTFHSFPVTDGNDKLVGVLTGNDFDLCDDDSLPAEKVMTQQVIYAPEGTTLEQAHQHMKKHRCKVLPIVDGEGRVVGLYTLSDVKRILSGLDKTNNVDARGQLRVGAAVGTGEEALQRVEMLHQENVDVIVIDSAHGDSEPVLVTLRNIKAAFPHLDVVAGNISEPDSAARLLEAGADGIKVGQGPGSICTTRKIAGVGCPQVTAVYNCARVAAEYDVPVCADGGIRYSGDIPIALAAGADSVMLGNLLAGTKEAPGPVTFYQGRQWKGYRGMGSLGALEANAASRERYRQTGKHFVPEGIEGLVPYKGELAEILPQYIGGLRNGMGYVGAASVAELQAKADFIRITVAGEDESHPHDVVITKEAPNYQRGDT